MKNRSVWILVGVILWGIPTGTLLSLMTAFIKPNTFIEMQSFQQAAFIHNLVVLVPIFAILGVFLGWILFEIGKKNGIR